MIMEEELDIQSVLGHRFNRDQYEFQVKIRGSSILMWLSENYLTDISSGILDAYRNEHGLFTDDPEEMLQLKKECTIDDCQRFLALEFNEAFQIKVEASVMQQMEVESQEFNNSDSSLNDTLFEANLNSLVNPVVKEENVEFTDDAFGSNRQQEHQFTNHVPSVTEIIENISNENLQNSSLIEDFNAVGPRDSMVRTTNDVENSMDIYSEIEVVSFENHEQPLENSSTAICEEPQSIENHLMESDRSSTINKYVGLGIIRKKAEDPRKALSSNRENVSGNSQISEMTNIQAIFNNLPVTNDIIIEQNGAGCVNLEPITSEIFWSIITKTDVELLETYLTNQRDRMVKLVSKDSTYLIHAARKNNYHFVGAILTLDVDINGSDNGKTALMYACENEDEAMINLLVLNGAFMNINTNGQNGVLYQCLLGDKLKSIQKLLHLGADYTVVQINPDRSLRQCAVDMKKDSVVKILDQHLSELNKTVDRNVLMQLGPHVHINQFIVPLRIISLFEIDGNSFEFKFTGGSLPVISENSCNLFLLMTGIIMGSTLKVFLSEYNMITKVLLNGVEQRSLLPGSYVSVASFSPLRRDTNIVIIHFENKKCRKIRLVLAACNVTVID